MIGVIGAVLFASGAAASGYLITRPDQIKPSVRRALAQEARTGLIGSAHEYAGPIVYAQPASPGTSTAVCPPGTQVLSGGYHAGSPPPSDASIADDGPLLPSHAWTVTLVNHGDGLASFRAVVICGQTR